MKWIDRPGDDGLIQRSRLAHLLLGAAVVLMILHPYTVYGKPGIVISVLFAVHALRRGISLQFFRDFVLPCLVLLLIATFGALSSAFHGIPQANHPSAVTSMFIMVLGAQGVYLACAKRGIGLNDFLMIVLMSMVINSAIVLVEIQFDPVRQMIEAYLDPLSGASINYAEGFRLRGIANSGGASLSLGIPAAFLIALHLNAQQRLSTAPLLAICFVLLASVVVIGRSGIVLLVVPIFGYLVLLIARTRDLPSLVRKIVGVTLMVAVVVPLVYGLLLDFFTDMFGEGFVTYAFGFLLEGGEGIRDEGTVGVVADFLTVLPLQFPEALTGFGFYGGSDFFPWTDSGFSRTFLSVGFIFGILFYGILLRMYLLGVWTNKYLVGCFVLLLCIAEAKEPLLYSGTASRMFILLLIFAYNSRADSRPARAVASRRCGPASTLGSAT